MHTLICAPANPMSTSAYYARAFEAFGPVTTLGPPLTGGMLDAWQQEEYRHHFKSGDFGAEEKYGLLRRMNRMADIPTPWGRVDARDIRLPEKPDLVVWIDGGESFLLHHPDAWGAPTVCILGDTHTDMTWRQELARHYEHVYLQFNRQHLSAFQDGRWLPPAFDPSICFPLPQVEKVYDVAFVGQTSVYHKRRVKGLRALKQGGLDVYVGSKLFQEMNLCFARAKIVFNCSLAGDFNMRVMEALGGQHFLLTDKLAPEAGLGVLFRDREHLVLYETDEELVDLAFHYLQHPAERARIANNGHREALDGHTYYHRAQQIVDELGLEETCVS